MAGPSGVLIRPVQGRLLAGVCLAIADRFGWNVTAVRIVTAIAVLSTGIGFALYIAFWIAVPSGV